ncbi:MAG: ACR3 family arsenite efflux transporter [Sphingobacteriia bacterium]|jgi:ACR3 family arsenite transporter
MVSLEKTAPRRLGFVDRYLSLWILLAMVLGVLLGQLVPGLPRLLGSLGSGSTNIPMAIGLILMMYPPLAKVRYEALPGLLRRPRLLAYTLLLNWLLAPLLMFALAALLLPDRPAYLQSLLLVGIAPCIAMVLVWIDLADGDREFAAGLVAINSLLQVLLFSAYAWVLLSVLPPLLGLQGVAIHIHMRQVASTVLLYLGTPLVAGFFTRLVLRRLRGDNWYTTRFLPTLAPLTPIALLATVVLMFSLQGEVLLQLPLDVLRIVLPLVLYFVAMFFLAFWLGRRAGGGYSQTAAMAFTASGNNFELAIAVSIGLFGLHSGQALAAVVGPLVEVPVLLGLVYAARYFARRYTWDMP